MKTIRKPMKIKQKSIKLEQKSIKIMKKMYQKQKSVKAIGTNPCLLTQITEIHAYSCRSPKSMPSHTDHRNPCLLTQITEIHAFSYRSPKSTIFYENLHFQRKSSICLQNSTFSIKIPNFLPKSSISQQNQQILNFPPKFTKILLGFLVEILGFLVEILARILGQKLFP